MANDDTTEPTPSTGKTPESNGESPPTRAGETVESLRQQVRDLEVALDKMTRQREETRRMLFEMYDQFLADHPPPTEDEIRRQRDEPPCQQSFGDLLTQLERETGGES